MATDGVTRCTIDLGTAHTFPDLTPIPARLRKTFVIDVLDDREIDGDWAVSEDIVRHGVWETVETAVLSSAFAGNPDSTFIDVGCHVGWYTVLARVWGLPAIAIDFSQRCLDLIEARNDPGITTVNAWIDKGWEPDIEWPEPCIVKMDIEGNEKHALKAMLDIFDVGSVTHCLMEVSPVFNKTYPAIIETMVEFGYEVWVLPAKQTPPPVMLDTRTWLLNYCSALHRMVPEERQEWVAAQHQFNAVICKETSRWG